VVFYQSIVVNVLKIDVNSLVKQQKVSGLFQVTFCKKLHGRPVANIVYIVPSLLDFFVSVQLILASAY
jgi:hypothetical protein|tara:strand:+ start:46719 stop:46922 length:204 start_codon:yes stop_codon:yes gene_type:complete